MRHYTKRLVAGLAANKGMELHDLVLGTPGLLEWLGQHFTTSSAIIGASNSSVLQLMHGSACQGAPSVGTTLTSTENCLPVQILWRRYWR